jgi:L-alanine-DL-glutamate epimerase-like enolase superfamily enzyme
MKIDRITLRAYRWTRDLPISNGRFTYDDAVTCVVQVDTDDGPSGVGLGVGVMLPLGERAVAGLVDVFDGLLRGLDPLATEAVAGEMYQPKLLGKRGIETRVASMIDIALWDIKGKHAGLPLIRLLGGAHESVPCYIAGGYYQEGKSLDDLAAEMAGYTDLGVRAVKMKVGRLRIREDAERVAAVRAAVGPDVELLVDANGSYTPDQAVRMARELERHDVFWFEEPLPSDDYTGHATVAAASSVPVATGENESTLFGFRDLLRAGGIGVLNPDAEIVGGVTAFMKVAALAEAADIPIAPHGRQELHVHLACAAPTGFMAEYYRPTVDPIAHELNPLQPELRDGNLFPPQRPGHGMQLDEKAVERYRVL